MDFSAGHLGTGDVLNEQEIECFTRNLKKIASAFSMRVSNEDMARNFINPFMVESVAKVKSDYPSLVLAVEQDFEGSCGYGFLDYLILYQELAIVITQAKMKIWKGISYSFIPRQRYPRCPFCSLRAPAYRLLMLETKAQARGNDGASGCLWHCVDR